LTLKDEWIKGIRSYLDEIYFPYLFTLPPEDIARIKKISKFQNPEDFWNGYFLGEMNGKITEFVKQVLKSGSELEGEEYIQIDEIILSYKSKIQEIINKLKLLEN